MALDILHDNWGPYTHTEVENALKVYLSGLETRINKAIQSGGVGLTDLSQEVQNLLIKAKTALQPDSIAAWAKAQNKPDYTVSEITYNNLLTLAEKLADMDQKIQAASQSGGTTPDAALSDTSENAVQNKVVKAAIDSLRSALDTLIGSGNVQGAIDTFNEVKAFLEGISSSDTLAAKLLLKADKATTYTKTETNEAIANAVKGHGGAVLDEGTHIPYNLLPRLVLDGMAHAHSDVQINTSNNGKCYFCADKKIRYYYDNGAKWVTSDPDKGIIYCDRSEKKLYIWNATQSKMEALAAGEGGLTEDDVNGLIASAINGYVQPDEAGRIPAALITEKDGKIPYSWMPSCFLDSINYAKGLKPTPELLGKVLFTTSGKILTVAATLVNNTSAYTWVEQDPSAGVLYWFDNRPYRWNPSEGLLEPYHICNIAIVGADEAVPDWADLCFFRASDEGGGSNPDEPVTPDPDDPTPPEPQVITIEGDNFNALLAGNDPQTVYNPSQLYELDGVVDADNLDNTAPGYSYVSQGEREDEGEAVVTGNRVSYKYTDASDVEHTVLTPLNYHGDLVLSNTVKMADTADTAYLSFMVSGPFIAPSTNVKVDFTDTDVEVYYWMKKNGKALQQIPSGHVFRFSNTEAAREVMLVIKRKSLGMGIGYTTTALKTYVDITRIQGGIFHPTRVAVIFNPTRVFYRNGGVVRGSGFSVANANAITLPEPYAGMSRASLSQGAGYLLFEKSGTLCPLITGVNFDMTKYNVFYAVLGNRDTSWQEAIVYNDAWGGAWVYDEQGNRTPRNQGDASIENSYCRSGAKPFHEIDSWINRVGNYILRCSVHNERAPKEALKTLDLYLAKVNSEMRVLEFGIITYDTSLL